MSLPTRWNAFGPLSRLDTFSDFDDLLRGLGARTPLAREYERAMDMRLDVNEDDKAYTVNVDMPGVKKDDIDISIERSQVTVRAEVKREASRGKGKELHRERYEGQAYRSFTLPAEIDSNSATATYDGGVLTLILPKKADTAARRLPIR